MARTCEVEEPAPDVAVATGGREADGGEAELGANGQPEILQHGSLSETKIFSRFIYFKIYSRTFFFF